MIQELQGALRGIKVKVKVKPFKAITSGSKWKIEYQHKGKTFWDFMRRRTG